MDIISAILSNSDYIAIFVAVVLLARAIARVTPNETDNKVVAFVRKLARGIGVDFPDRQK